MTDAPDQSRPWLIAAWPGMGNVAIIAAAYLIQRLEMQAVGDLPPRGHFDVPQVEVKSGGETRQVGALQSVRQSAGKLSPVEALPEKRKALYNWRRGSKVFLKRI